ncbi:MAG: HAD family hydrolase [Syntrophales bacterium LBB04]|nr:HAD family hydrolase [Syntrophales bacterium LBB04]
MQAVFLDRDGTINEEVGYLDSLNKLVIYPQAYSAIKMINDSGMKAIVITNQSGVARGYFTEEFVKQLHGNIQELLNARGAYIDAFYYCPHHPEGQEPYRRHCLCRKPEAGLLREAAKQMNISLEQSYMIGDMAKDIEAGFKAGLQGILVRTGYGKETEKEIGAGEINPAYIADDLLDAVSWIMKCENR